MKQVKELPKEGQFVAVWEYDGETECSKCQCKDGILKLQYWWDVSREYESSRLAPQEFNDKHNPIYYMAE